MSIVAAVMNRHDGLIHGMIMFGLSVVAALVIVFLGRASSIGISTMSGATRVTYLLDFFGASGWVTFVALLLGWLAAMGRAATGAERRIQPERAVQPIRPAA